LAYQKFEKFGIKKIRAKFYDSPTSFGLASMTLKMTATKMIYIFIFMLEVLVKTGTSVGIAFCLFVETHVEGLCDFV
jgi:hypothetical protein